MVMGRRRRWDYFSRYFRFFFQNLDTVLDPRRWPSSFTSISESCTLSSDPRLHVDIGRKNTRGGDTGRNEMVNWLTRTKTLWEWTILVVSIAVYLYLYQTTRWPEPKPILYYRASTFQIQRARSLGSTCEYKWFGILARCLKHQSSIEVTVSFIVG